MTAFARSQHSQEPDASFWQEVWLSRRQATVLDIHFDRNWAHIRLLELPRQNV
jgi:hypothetical protein